MAEVEADVAHPYTLNATSTKDLREKLSANGYDDAELNSMSKNDMYHAVFLDSKRVPVDEREEDNTFPFTAVVEGGIKRGDMSDEEKLTEMEKQPVFGRILEEDPDKVAVAGPGELKDLETGHVLHEASGRVSILRDEYPGENSSLRKEENVSTIEDVKAANKAAQDANDKNNNSASDTATGSPTAPGTVSLMERGSEDKDSDMSKSGDSTSTSGEDTSGAKAPVGENNKDGAPVPGGKNVGNSQTTKH